MNVWDTFHAFLFYTVAHCLIDCVTAGANKDVILKLNATSNPHRLKIETTLPTRFPPPTTTTTTRSLAAATLTTTKSTTSTVLTTANQKPDRVEASGIFKELAETDDLFVDKSLFVNEVFLYPEQVLAFSRPRMMGKSSALDMLNEFVNIDGDFESRFKHHNLTIFDDDYTSVRNDHMNKYRVVVVDFRTVCQNKRRNAWEEIKYCIRKAFFQFSYLLEADISGVTGFDTEIFGAVLNNTAMTPHYSHSIFVLCKMIHLHHGKKPIVIFDETDAFVSDYADKRSFDTLTGDMHSFFSASLKQNIHASKIIICSVLPLFKMKPFSGVNSVEAFSIAENEFRTSFGFTKNEVIALMNKDGVKQKLNGITIEDLSKWYNQVMVGDEPIFNPKAVKKCLKRGGKLEVYSDPLGGSLRHVADFLLFKGGFLPLLDFQVLLQKHNLDRAVLFFFEIEDIFERLRGYWTYFYHAGLVVKVPMKSEDGRRKVGIRLAGEEIRIVLNKCIHTRTDLDQLPDYDKFTEKVKAQDYDYIKEKVIKYVRNAGRYLKGIGNRGEIDMEQLRAYLKEMFLGYSRLYKVKVQTRIIKNKIEIIVKHPDKGVFFPRDLRVRVVVKPRDNQTTDRDWIGAGSTMLNIVCSAVSLLG